MDYMNSTDTPGADNESQTPRSSLTDILRKHLAKMPKTQSDDDRNTILIISYSLIVIISLAGNLMVCKVLFERTGQALTTTNKLIVNLAISDLLMTTLNIPFNIVRLVLDNWPFGDTMCVLVPFIQSTSVHVSSLTMMFIAIERFRSIMSDRRSNNSLFGRLLTFNRILFIIWLTATLFSIPHGVYNRVVVIPELKNLERCQVVYPEPKQQFRQRLTLIAFLTQYLIPIMLTCVCYIRISLFLWRRKIVGTVGKRQRMTMARRKRRRINMLILVVMVFAICWLPLNVFHLLTDYQIITYSSTFFFANHWLAMSSVCYNPFIYCWLNKDFKQRVRRLFRCNASAGTAGAVNGRSGNRESTVVRNESCDQITLQSIHCNNNDNNNSQTPVNNDQML